MKPFFLDFETYSEADLKKVGAYEYTKHPSTEILCAAWKTPGGIKVSSFDFDTIKNDVVFAAREGYTLVAHNSLFEQCVIKNVLKLDIPPERFLCTAALAASHALPRSLDGASQALGLKYTKDKEGHRVMLKLSKPKKPSRKDPSTRYTDKADMEKLLRYCATDVDVEEEIYYALPPLNPKERKIWVLDQQINFRGFQVDRPMVASTLKMIEEHTANLDFDVMVETCGEVSSVRKTAKLKEALNNDGTKIENVQKATIEAFLKDDSISDLSRFLLEARLSGSKSSTSKYQAFINRSRSDGRVRDNLLYHGASTGRWSGAGVQIQNFPRGTIKNIEEALPLLEGGSLETVKLFYDRPMEVFSSALRSMIVAPKGRVLDVADYAAIEARMLFWFADHAAGVSAFKEGRDLYVEMAAILFRKRPEDVTPAERTVGKTVILAAGYGMGAPKFASTCQNFGLSVDDDLAKKAIDAYRTLHRPVVKMWSNMEKVAIAAVTDKTKKYTINHTKWFMEGKFLYCELPSGRRLAYYGPEMRVVKTKWGENKWTLHHWGIGKNRQWELQPTYGGLLTENVVQAGSRDVMAEAMLRIDAAKVWDIIFTVHDELVAERDEGAAEGIKEFCALMAEPPVWAPTAPISATGFTTKRYRK